MVVGLAAIHLILDLALSSSPSNAIPAGIPVALLVVPVFYAALHFGFAGSVSTSLWATVLWLPDLLLPHDRGHAGNDLIELGVVIAVAVFVGRHIELERLARLRAEHAEAEHRAAEERVRGYAGLLVGAQEEERRRLAQELHDEPLQILVYLTRQLERLEAAPGLAPEVAKELARAREQAAHTLVDLRSVVKGLRPAGIDGLGLVAALRGFLTDVTDTTGTPCDLVVTGSECRLDPAVELGMFRIAQESVNNAVRHAAADQLRARLDFGGDQVTLLVSDDGCGFDPEALQTELEASHLGIRGMQERAGLLGGHLDVRSTRGLGTTVQARVPRARGPEAEARDQLTLAQNSSSSRENSWRRSSIGMWPQRGSSTSSARGRPVAS